MRIFFDYQAFALQRYGGISRYYCELIKGLNSRDVHHAHLSILWSNNVNLREYNIYNINYPFNGKFNRLLHKSNKIYNFLDYKSANFDIYHSTYFDNFLSTHIRSKPIIATYHDMTYERLGYRFIELSADKQIIGQKKKMANQASHIISVSESTKQDMIELLDINPNKITVIPLSSSFNNTEKRLKATSYEPKKPYLLYVGKRAGYKNFLPLLEAIAHLLIRYQLTLVCAGGGSFSKAEIEVINKTNCSAWIEYKDINDSILQELYSNAQAFIFPSLYEGFGIPILEAFSCNCPCVVSDVSSLPEVAGNAAAYFDPNSADSMATAVESIIIDESLRSKLIQNGHQRVISFSWERTINDTVNLYNKFT